MTSYPELKKAESLEMVDSAVQFNVPVGPDHPFFINFSDVRGDFQERVIYRALNVNPKNFTFNPELNPGNKSLIFLAGMRGSGKTSELAKYVKNLNKSDCFYCIVCNIDQELDMNYIEYMDILIFQLEKLVQRASHDDLNLDNGVIKSLQKWFAERVNEINKNIKGEAGLEIGVEAGGGLSRILSIFGSLKAGVSGSIERASSIRSVLKNRFSDFALKFNEFIEEVNSEIRIRRLGKEILFVIDGLEKTMSSDTRRKIILEESNRLQQIRANTIFTLPIELMKEQRKIEQFSKVIAFPFIKIREKNGEEVPEAIARFKKFVFRRINKKLFESEATVEKIIRFSGGSPRELLRILEYSNYYSNLEKNLIDENAVDQAIRKLSAEASKYLTPGELDKLKEVKENNIEGLPTPFDEKIQDLLERLILLEYNDGTYKRVNPIVEVSELYRNFVDQKPPASGAYLIS